MSKRWKWILGILALVVIIGFIYRRSTSRSKTLQVAVDLVSTRTIEEVVPTTGKIYPGNEVHVTPDFSGQVTELKVAEGDHVKKDQVLAWINNRTSITSPIEGTVLTVNVKKGESVTGNNFSKGTEMFVIADMNTFEVRVDVGENDIVKISNGDSVTIMVDAYNNRKFPGIVSKIANTVRQSAGSFNSADNITSYEVRISLDSASYKDLGARSFPFRPGMNASADIRTIRKENIMAVPRAAVAARVSVNPKDSTAITSEAEEVVFVVGNDNIAHRKAIRTGILDLNYIEIVSGLNTGERVIIAPYEAVSKTLQDGQKVNVVDKNRLFK